MSRLPPSWFDPCRLDSDGQQIAGLNGSLFRRYTFTLNNASGQEMGRIVKQWGGILREGFTDADTFSIQFSDVERSQEIRLLLISIRLCH